ncbi:MAG: hypothetical protein WCI81_02885 [Chlorobiaceae bacterium]
MLAKTILKVATQIPWDKVIELAPSVAERAGTLWKSIKSKNKRLSVDESSVYTSYTTELSESDLLKARLERLEEQIQVSAGLLKTLAEQNTSLVQQIELHQARLFRQSLIFIGVAAVLAGLIVYLFIR